LLSLYFFHVCCVIFRFFLVLQRRPPCSARFPYTTLFRSRRLGVADGVLDAVLALLELHLGRGTGLDHRDAARELGQALLELKERSEEHTSELQSRENLVCRLLLEKKKI